GIRNGRIKAIVKFVTKIEMTVYSIFPFNRFTITGDAIAVGAIAVIKTICDNSMFNGFIRIYEIIGTNKFINKI
ncbi:MAG: hypothetical protein KDC88_00315, partial [Ignavibacteriae bacterium]|nr:hypothetical protein [Ignavibacteriota bacterium]